MIPIQRLGEPRILREKKADWTADFQNSGKSRPESKRYAHQEIRESLGAMSHQKCFYCEVLDAEMTVDHYVEVAEAFRQTG